MADENQPQSCIATSRPFQQSQQDFNCQEKSHEDLTGVFIDIDADISLSPAHTVDSGLAYHCRPPLSVLDTNPLSRSVSKEKGNSRPVSTPTSSFSPLDPDWCNTIECLIATQSEDELFTGMSDIQSSDSTPCTYLFEDEIDAGMEHTVLTSTFSQLPATPSQGSQSATVLSLVEPHAGASDGLSGFDVLPPMPQVAQDQRFFCEISAHSALVPAHYYGAGGTGSMAGVSVARMPPCLHLGAGFKPSYLPHINGSLTAAGGLEDPLQNVNHITQAPFAPSSSPQASTRVSASPPGAREGKRHRTPAIGQPGCTAPGAKRTRTSEQSQKPQKGRRSTAPGQRQSKQPRKNAHTVTRPHTPEVQDIFRVVNLTKESAAIELGISPYLLGKYSPFTKWPHSKVKSHTDRMEKVKGNRKMKLRGLKPLVALDPQWLVQEYQVLMELLRPLIKDDEAGKGTQLRASPVEKLFHCPFSPAEMRAMQGPCIGAV